MKKKSNGGGDGPICGRSDGSEGWGLESGELGNIGIGYGGSSGISGGVRGGAGGGGAEGDGGDTI